MNAVKVLPKCLAFLIKWGRKFRDSNHTCIIFPYTLFVLLFCLVAVCCTIYIIDTLPIPGDQELFLLMVILMLEIFFIYRYLIPKREPTRKLYDFVLCLFFGYFTCLKAVPDLHNKSIGTLVVVVTGYTLFLKLLAIHKALDSEKPPIPNKD